MTSTVFIYFEGHFEFTRNDISALSLDALEYGTILDGVEQKVDTHVVIYLAFIHDHVSYSSVLFGIESGSTKLIVTNLPFKFPKL